MKNNLKIDRNRRAIEELQKIATDRNYLKNIHSKKEPTFIELDREK